MVLVYWVNQSLHLCGGKQLEMKIRSCLDQETKKLSIDQAVPVGNGKSSLYGKGGGRFCYKDGGLLEVNEQ